MGIFYRLCLFIVGEIIAGSQWMCATAACSPFVLYVLYEGRKVRAVYFLCGTAALSAVACFLYPTSNVQWEGAREQALPSILALCACNERRVNATAIALFHAN